MLRFGVAVPRRTTVLLQIATITDIKKRRRQISSIGFSGAGFLIAYHLGVASCLSDQRLLPSSLPHHHHNHYQHDDTNKKHIKFTGVSAGSLVAAALLAHVDPATDGMNAVLQISHTTREQSRTFDALQPGFSLIDVVESVFTPLLINAVSQNYDDPESFLRRINEHQLLRIGLTDRRVFPPIGYNPAAVVYVDTYRCINDVIASCILSSYIPGVTGPALGNMALKNYAVTRAAKQFTEMIYAGCVKKGTTGETIHPSPQLNDTGITTNEQARTTTTGSTNHHHSNFGGREICWDGGLVNAFPTIDDQTIIVSPIAADFVNNPSISPAIEYDNDNTQNNPKSLSSSTSMLFSGLPSVLKMGKIVINPVVTFHVTAANAASIRCMIISSDDTILQQKFHQGYDNAKQYCIQNGLLTIHHHFISKSG